MNRKARSLAALLVVGAIITACSDRQNKGDVLAEDTSLVRDLALANQDTASKPELRDIPIVTEPAPVVSEPAPAPTPRVERRAATPVVRKPAARTATPSPAPETLAVRVTASGNTERATEGGSEKPLGVISSGSEIALSAGQRVCTNTNSVGDKFTAQIADPVMGANGTVIPVGATAIVAITSLKQSKSAGDNIEIGLRVESISYAGKTYAISSETTYAQVDRVRVQSGTDDAKKVATGAAIGAVLGQILGHRTKSTVIGAATGAAAGAVVANRTADYDGCVPSGGKITIRLTEPLTIQATE